jgi:hypothetical protein
MNRHEISVDEKFSFIWLEHRTHTLSLSTQKLQHAVFCVETLDTIPFTVQYCISLLALI